MLGMIVSLMLRLFWNVSVLLYFIVRGFYVLWAVSLQINYIIIIIIKNVFQVQKKFKVIAESEMLIQVEYFGEKEKLQGFFNINGM